MRSLPSFALLFIVVGLSAGALRAWDVGGPYIAGAGRFPVALGCLLLLSGLALSVVRRKRVHLEDAGNIQVWALGLVAVFVSDWMCRSFVFLQGPSIRGELLLGAVLSFFLAAKSRYQLLRFAPFLAAPLVAWSFFVASKGTLLFSDDHAMFLFRLHLLKENFPFIPFWSPVWNAGIDARDFFATGALNAFLLTAPLIYSFNVDSVYNVVVALIVWGLVPAATYGACVVLGADRTTRGIASLLSLCTGLVWYKWALKYGTMGFVTSAGLIPLVVALTLRFLSGAPLRRLDVTLLVATSSLMLLWSPSGIALAPLALLAIPALKPIVKSPRHLVTIGLLVAINVPCMYTLWRVSSVGKFLSSHKESSVTVESRGAGFTENGPSNTAPPTKPTAFRHRSSGLDLRRSLELWQESASSMNPLFVIFAVPALLRLRGRQRWAFGSLSLWLLALGTVAVPLFPQLELDRMLVLMSIVLCYPVASLVTELFREGERSLPARAAAGIAGSFVLVSPFGASAIALNRSWEHYSFLSAGVGSLSDVLKRESSGGRALFSGCVLHELSGGHLAPLALWSETPLVASSYAHNIWKYEQIIPKSYMERDDAGIDEYFDHMNASVVLAHEPYWRTYFSTRKDVFTEVWRGEGFIAYKRILYTPTYVLHGDADSFTQNSNSVTLTPRSDRVVIKFRYFPFLTSSSCHIAPFSVAPELDLIELSSCVPGEPVTVRSVGLVERLFPEHN